jgi:hypothetical protein
MDHEQDEADALWRAATRDGAAQADGLALARYERSVIAHIFKRRGVANGPARLAAKAREETGTATLGLRLFNAHADFPLRLVAAKLRLVEMPMGDVFRRPTATPVHRAHAEAVLEYPDEQALALVFRWRGFGERMVLHTLPREFAEPGAASRTKLVYALGRPRLPPLVYTIEDLDGLLAAIGWMRTDEEHALRPPRDHDVRRGRRGRPGGQAGGE